MRTSEKATTRSAAPAFSRDGLRHKSAAQTSANGMVASATSPRHVHGSEVRVKYAATPTVVTAASTTMPIAAQRAGGGGRIGPVESVCEVTSPSDADGVREL